MTPVAIHERNMETGLEVVTFGIEGEAPIGSMNAMDAPDPLALNAHEASVVASWSEENGAATDGEAVVTSYGSVEQIVSTEDAKELELLTGMTEDKDSGLLLPAQEVEAEAQKSGFFTGLKDKAANFVKEHPKLAKAAAVAGAITTLVAAAPDTAQASWTHLGGDPLVKGGVHTRADFVRMMTSHKGKTAMSYAGLDGKEIRALVRGAREGDEYRCEMPYGEKFKAMSYGINGTSVDPNVRFKDPDYIGNPAPAWCMDEAVDLNGDGKFDEKVHIKVPVKCGNFGLVSITPITHPHQPKHHPKKLAPVFVAKEALTEQGDLMKHTPSDTFHALVKCRQYGKVVTSNVTINMGPNGEPVFALKCNVGTSVTGKELATTGPDQWINLTNAFQKQTVRKKGNVFTWKDQEVGKPGHTPTCEETQPAEVCHPKDGSQGPGTTVPTQPGGPGSGGDGNPSQNAVACYDIATSTDGDMNPATEGAPMWGTAKDQNDNCVGPATAA